MSAFSSILEIIDHRANTQADDLAYRHYTHEKSVSLTYSELQTAIHRLGHFLKNAGVKRDPILIALPPGLDYVVAVYTCLYIGAIPIPAYPPKRNHNNKRLLNIIENVSAKHVISSKFKANLWPSELRVFSVETIGQAPVAALKPYPCQPNELAFLQYTSGTTSLPKGVMVNHANILANLNLMDHLSHGEIQKTCSWLPPYHDMGLIAGIFLPLYSGVPAILIAPAFFLQSPFRWLELISKERVSTTYMPNFAFDYCVDKTTQEQVKELDLSSLKHVFNGAEPIHHQTAQRFYEHFKNAKLASCALLTGYGLAEATLIVTGARDNQWTTPLYLDKNALAKGLVQLQDKSSAQSTDFVSSGATFPLHEVAIVDPQSKVKLPELSIGEIWLNGPSVTAGYWNHPEKNKEIFTATLSDNTTKTYLRTSDLGFLYQNELYVTGRMNDLLIIRGANFYAHELEYTAMHAHPALQINGSAVFTITEQENELLCIAQELQREQVSSADYQAIIASIRREMLAEHGLQADIILLLTPNGVLKTSSGKIQRNDCKQAYLNQALPIEWAFSLHSKDRPTPPALNDIEAWLFAWIAKRNGVAVNNLAPSTLLAELGFDSIAAAELTADAAKQFNLPLDIGDVIENKTRAELVAALAPTTATTPFIARKTIKTLIQAQTHPFETALKALYSTETEGVSAATIKVKQQEWLNFSGYNYLGLSGSPFVTQAAIHAITTYGTSVSASRIASGQKPLHRQLEQAIANLIGTDDCLVYSAGHATNISVITQLFGAGDLIIYDVLSHNSLMQGIQFSGAKAIAFPHNDCNALETILASQAEQFNKVLIVTEGIFSMDGDIPNIPAMLTLKKRYNAFLMIDEAHSIGTLGESGAGVREYFNLAAAEVDIWMGTLSKAFASCGGYIAGSSDLIQHLRFYAQGFVYSAGISPANTAAALAAIQCMQQEPERIKKLHANQTSFLARLKAQHIPTGNSYQTPIIPVIVADDEKALQFAQQLQANRIYALPIVYPAVARNAARVRFFMSALHTDAQLQHAAEVIVKYFPYSRLAVNH